MEGNNNNDNRESRQKWDFAKEYYQIALKQEKDISAERCSIVWCAGSGAIAATLGVTILLDLMSCCIFFTTIFLSTSIIFVLLAINTYLTMNNKKEINKKFAPKLESASQIQIPNQTK